ELGDEWRAGLAAQVTCYFLPAMQYPEDEDVISSHAINDIVRLERLHADTAEFRALGVGAGKLSDRLQRIGEPPIIALRVRSSELDDAPVIKPSQIGFGMLREPMLHRRRLCQVPVGPDVGCPRPSVR